MAEENNVSEGTNNSIDQSVNSPIQSETRDFESSYNQEIENSKKLRKRAQEAEKKIADYEAKAKIAKEKKLKEEGNFKELLAERDAHIAKTESQYNEASEIISSEKQRLLESFPEDDRGDFENLNLTQLRKIHNKLNVKRPDNRPSQKSAAHNPLNNKKYSDMSDAERREYHKQMMSGSLKR